MIGKNLLSGFASSGLSAVLGFLFVPLYIKYLGIESYGLIGFFATMQAVLALLDMGIAPTMNREAARFTALGGKLELANLLRTLSLLYWGIGVIAFLAIFALAPYIADHWLQATGIDSTRLIRNIILMGLVFSCRWPIGLYQSTLVGMQKIATVSAISMAMSILVNFGAWIVLANVSTTIEAFFIWQAIVALLNLMLVYWITWSCFNIKSSLSFQSLKNVWKFSAGMSGIAFSSIFLMQLDKILLSKLLPLKLFGYYSLAVVFAGSLSLLINPIFNVIFPRLSELVAEGNEKNIFEFYMTGTQLLAGILFPVALIGAFFTNDILVYWVRDGAIVSEVAPIAALLLIGGALNGVMIFPYALQLAHGMTKLPLVIILSLISLYVPLTYYLVITYGAIGGALSWLLLNLSYLMNGPWLTHKFILKNSSLMWLCKGVMWPAIISLATIYTGWALWRTHDSHLVNLLLGCFLGSLAILFNYLFWPKHIHAKINLYRASLKIKC